MFKDQYSLQETKYLRVLKETDTYTDYIGQYVVASLLPVTLVTSSVLQGT